MTQGTRFLMLMGLALVNFAHAGASQGCQLAQNLDFREINPVAYLGGENAGFEEKKGGSGLVNLSRRLAFFVLGEVEMPKDLKGKPLGVKAKPGERKPVDEPGAWGMWAHKNKGCHCPLRNAKEVEYALIRYCGGLKDKDCCAQLQKENAAIMDPCCQKQLCEQTGWAHGNLYLPLCFQGWNCG